MTQIITDLDRSCVGKSHTLTNKLKNKTFFKFGLEYAEKHGPNGILELELPDYTVFLDHKWHDNSDTVAFTARAAVYYRLKPLMVTVSAMGWLHMMHNSIQMLKPIARRLKLLLLLFQQI